MKGETRSPFVAMLRGLTRRCPRCGRGKLFRQWFRIVKACPRCGLVFEREEGARIASATLNYGITGLALIVYLVVALVLTLPDPPQLELTLGALGVILVVALVTFPFAKTTWSAIDYVLSEYQVKGKDRSFRG